MDAHLDHSKVDRPGRTFLLSFGLALLAGIVALLVSDAWRAGFSGADEPAHFINSYFISAYIREALGSNPMAFATEFYLHYPKISIGHWPPAYYALLSPIFFILPPTPATAFAVNLLIAALPSALAGLLAARLTRLSLGIVVALLSALTPVAIEGQAFFMVDQPLAAVTLGAAILWFEYVRRPAPWLVLGFACLAATAVLMKGNGWLLLFVPPIHLALAGRWKVLASPWPWAAGLLAGLIVAPWYWLTAGISADGFNYSPGPAYAWEALLFNLTALSDNVTIVGLGAAAYGIAVAFRDRRSFRDRWIVAAGCASLILATLLLQSLVPVDLDPRYMAPALPALLVLAAAGAWDVVRRWKRFGIALAAAGSLIVAVPGISHLGSREPKIDLRMAEAVSALPDTPSAWVIDGTSGAEGAFIAAMAVRDPELRSYSVRSSRLLAQSDFMGNEYRLVTSDPAEVLARLRTLGAEGVVIARPGHRPAFPHSALLRRALASPGSPYRLATILPHRNRPGVTEIFRARSPARMNESAIRALGLPEKAGALTAK
jgi:4-amino-4-deoxy-L-arabinose transferase-like glycosyltransferase